MLNTTELLERLVKEYEVVSGYVIRGQCISMEDYRAQTARLRTLEQVEAIAKGADKKNEGGKTT